MSLLRTRSMGRRGEIEIKVGSDYLKMKENEKNSYQLEARYNDLSIACGAYFVWEYA